LAGSGWMQQAASGKTPVLPVLVDHGKDGLASLISAKPALDTYLFYSEGHGKKINSNGVDQGVSRNWFQLLKYSLKTKPPLNTLRSKNARKKILLAANKLSIAERNCNI